VNKKNVVVDVMSYARLAVTMPVLLAIGAWYLVRGDIAWKTLRRRKQAQEVAINAGAGKRRQTIKTTVVKTGGPQT
jgi:hypothetical protein